MRRRIKRRRAVNPKGDRQILHERGMVMGKREWWLLAGGSALAAAVVVGAIVMGNDEAPEPEPEPLSVSDTATALKHRLPPPAPPPAMWWASGRAGWPSTPRDGRPRIKCTMSIFPPCRRKNRNVWKRASPSLRKRSWRLCWRTTPADAGSRKAVPVLMGTAFSAEKRDAA